MANFLKRAELNADAATTRALLNQLADEDILGRLSLGYQQDEFDRQLKEAEGAPDTLASTALYFGGRPVIGSIGIEADFASEVLADYKDLIVKVWATTENDVASRGPVPDQASAKLHVTSLLRGSMGFLIEEIDLKATPMFPTPLKLAADAAADLVISVARESDEQFTAQLEGLHPRVFLSVQHLYNLLHKSEAVLRLVDSHQDELLNRDSIDKGYVRLEQAQMEESEIKVEGLLQGIIPEGARFEFRLRTGQLIEGSVAPTMSEAYLTRLERDQAIGKYFNARIQQKDVRRFGRTTTKYTLLDLEEPGATADGVNGPTPRIILP